MTEKLADIYNIKEKTVVLTGAAGYFGRYISRSFLEVGAKMILISRSDRIDKQAKEYINEFGQDKVVCYKVDFYDLENLKRTFNKIVNKHNVDVLINNAYDLSVNTGFNTDKGALENLNYTNWKKSFESGIYWAVFSTQIIGEHFKKKKKGSIINVSSMYGLVSPSPDLYEGEKFLNPATYTVNKSGIIAFTKYVASFWGKYNIRCNAIAPGPFSNTEEENSNSVNENEDFLKKLKQKTVLDRIGHPKELIGGVIFLASDASSYVTGHVLTIDGGWTIT